MHIDFRPSQHFSVPCLTPFWRTASKFCQGANLNYTLLQ